MNKWIKANKKKLLIYLPILVVVLILDIVTKKVAIANLVEGTSVEIIKNFFYFSLCYNTGAAWSSFANSIGVLIAISVIASVGLTVYYFRKDPDRSTLGNIALSLIIAGAVGNGIDRIIYHKVTDFLDFYIFGYDFPVFNFADSCVVVGVILIIIYLIITPDDSGEPSMKELRKAKKEGKK